MRRARTIAINRLVRVFAARGQVFGCRRSADRAYALARDGEDCVDDDAISGAVLGGNFASLHVITCSLDGREPELTLINLRDGRVRFRSPPLSTRVPAIGFDAIRGMVVRADGGLAWLGVRISGGAIVEVEVRRRLGASARRSMLLDAGPDIDPRSLRLLASRVHWRRAGVARSAPLG